MKPSTNRRRAHYHVSLKPRTSTKTHLARIWRWYHRPGVRPVHFHAFRALLFIGVAYFMVWIVGSEQHQQKTLDAIAVSYKSIELVCEIVADRIFPVSIPED